MRRAEGASVFALARAASRSKAGRVDAEQGGSRLQVQVQVQPCRQQGCTGPLLVAVAQELPAPATAAAEGTKSGSLRQDGGAGVRPQVERSGRPR